MPKLKCCGCKDRFPKESMIKTPAGNFHSPDCLADFAIRKYKEATKRRLDKVKADTKKQRKADKKQARDVNRSKLRWQHKHTQVAFNKMRVLEELLWFKERGLEPTCISCGKPVGGDIWSCGHLKTVGAQGCLRYDVKNTFLQHSYNCNRCLSGDIYGTKKTRGYIKGLLERFGDEEGSAIIHYCQTNTQTVKWEWRQLEEMRAEFRKRIKLLEQQLN